MAGIYKHGTYGEFAQSVSAVAIESGTTVVYVGIAPVNLVRGYATAGLVNKPIHLMSFTEAQEKMGYSADWQRFSLCEAFKLHFNNTAGNVGGIVAINVLDPSVHRKSAVTTEALTFVNGRATIESDSIILDTLVLADKVEGVDFTVSYDYTATKVIISSIGDKISGSVTATFSEIDTTSITAEAIIGGATADGAYTGLGAVELIYQTLGVIPNVIAAPGWSENPSVYEAMITAGTKINGHWDAFVVADIPIKDGENAIDTMAKAVEWAKSNGYDNERTKVCWPQAINTSGEIFHVSTLCAWRMQLVDATHNGIPMETPSNKPVPIAKQYFGADSTNAGFDQSRGNTLNANGITTIVYFGGAWVLWGGHTAAYKHGAVSDNRVIFDNSVRMMMHITNSFQQDWALTIDAPMTVALKDTIKQREQEKADALAAVGALIGRPEVQFVQTANSISSLIEGDFVWDFSGTPAPQFKSGTIRVAYTTAGFTSYFGEEV